MNFYDLSARERAILIVCVMMCFTYVVYAFIYRPFVVEQERIEMTIVRELKKFREQTLVIAREEQKPATLRQAVEGMRQQVPNEEVFSGMLSEIVSAARSFNIRVVEIKPQTVSVQDGFNRFAVSLAVDGSFLDLMRFLHHVQAPGFDLTVLKFDLEKSLGTPGVFLAKIVLQRVLFPQANGESNTKNVSSKK